MPRVISTLTPIVITDLSGIKQRNANITSYDSNLVLSMGSKFFKSGSNFKETHKELPSRLKRAQLLRNHLHQTNHII